MNKVPTIESAISYSIDAIQAGKVHLGERGLIWVLKQDPENSKAWYWLSQCREDGIAKRICLEKVIELDSSDTRARDELERLNNRIPLQDDVPAGTVPVESHKKIEEDPSVTIEEKLEISRMELLDLGLRNPLINHRLYKSKGLKIVDEKPREVFRILVLENKNMSFLSAPEEEEQTSLDLPYEEDARDFLGQPEEEEGIADRHIDNKLQTSHTSADLQKRLLNTYHTAKRHIEERGVSVLFLTLGMLKWYEAPSSDKVRSAPLILVPVELSRTDIKARFRIRYADQEIGDNLSLNAKLNTEFGIKLPGIPEIEDLDIRKFFADLSNVIKHKDRWSVDSEAIAIGFFSFGKFLMFNDLDDAKWGSGNRPTDHPIMKALLETGFSGPQEYIDDDLRIDDIVYPGDVNQVVDADSSQTLAILDVKEGTNLVIQGPPGTGKSQTITNLIAEALGSGKKVLFVAEKMAALEVVKRRLDNIGLGDACLELHSHKTNKKTVIKELERTLNLGKPSDKKDFEYSYELVANRDQLNAYCDAVNNIIGESGVTPYRVYGKLLQFEKTFMGREIPRIDDRHMASWTGMDLKNKLSIVKQLQSILVNIGPPSEHPYWGCQWKVILPADKERIQRLFRNALKNVGYLSDSSIQLANRMKVRVPDSRSGTQEVLNVGKYVLTAPNLEGINVLSDGWRIHWEEICQAIELGEKLKEIKETYSTTLNPDAWKVDLTDTKSVLEEYGLKWWRYLSSNYKKGLNTVLALYSDKEYIENYQSQLHGSSQSSDELIDQARTSLGNLSRTSLEISQYLNLDPPDRFTQVGILQKGAQRVLQAPNVRGVQIADKEWFQNQNSILRFLNQMARRSELHETYDRMLSPEAWKSDVATIQTAFDRHGSKLFRILSKEYREAKKSFIKLLASDSQKIKGSQGVILNAISEYQELQRNTEESEERFSKLFGNQWMGSRSDWQNLTQVTKYLGGLHDEVERDAQPPELFEFLSTFPKNLEDLKQAYSHLLSGIEKYKELVDGIAQDIDRDSTAISGDGEKFKTIPFSAQDIVFRTWQSESERQKWLASHLEVVTSILKAQEVSHSLDQHTKLMEANFDNRWNGEQSDWPNIKKAAGWLNDLHNKIHNEQLPPTLLAFLSNSPNFDELEKSLQELTHGFEEQSNLIQSVITELRFDETSRYADSNLLIESNYETQTRALENWIRNIDKLQDIVSYNHIRKTLVENELMDVVDLVYKRPDVTSLLSEIVERAWYESLLNRSLTERPILAGFNGGSHSQTVKAFRKHDISLLQQTRIKLLHEHWKGLPRKSRSGQLGILLREFSKKRRLLPIRKLIRQAGNVIQVIKPVFMMSPLSIAMYLPPESIKFDLVIFDEASQVKPVDAFGAILRGKQIVVVGDTKQLPPTTFFESLIDIEDEDFESPTADLESILGLMNAQGAHERMLRWHYRSQHESLIAVSNHEFYDNKLVIFPSPDREQEEVGLFLHYLPETTYDRGKSRANLGEARKVAEEVMKHARDRGHLSLGVASFNQSQAQAIQDQLEILRRQDPSCEAFFADHPEEPFFTKNLENVQGDERDVTFISIGYGRDAAGKITMNFGPLNQHGGERRLNVLITRAKKRCEVFTNLSADDIDLRRTQSRGVEALKLFLKYAQTGELEIPTPSWREPDSPFEGAVADALRNSGYQVEHQVGSAGYFIDLAVIDDIRQGRYLLGIECDGATYHRAKTARDRDRLRQEVLENLGWKIHRIWSTDWFQNQKRELVKLIKAIEKAKSAPTSMRRKELSIASETNTREPSINRSKSSTKSKKLNHTYRVAQLVVRNKKRPIYELPAHTLETWIEKVVEVESPVHIDETIRRITDALGIGRVSQKAKDFLISAIKSVAKKRRIRKQRNFLWWRNKRALKIRDRVNLPAASRKIELIAPEEIMFAIEMVVSTSFGIPRKDIPSEVCSLFGFGRSTKGMRKRINTIISRMLKSGSLMTKDEFLILTEELP